MADAGRPPGRRVAARAAARAAADQIQSAGLTRAGRFSGLLAPKQDAAAWLQIHGGLRQGGIRDRDQDREDKVQVEESVDPMYSPSQDAVAHETAERLEAAFTQLPEDYQRVITLSRIVGMDHMEIAEDMGRQEGAVRVLLHRALVRLGRLMDEW